jgi:hypothetical protein
LSYDWRGFLINVGSIALILSVVAVNLTAANGQNAQVYGQVVSLKISPAPAAAYEPIIFSGKVSYNSLDSPNIMVSILVFVSSAGCGGVDNPYVQPSLNLNFNVLSDGSFLQAFNVTATGGLAPGSYIAVDGYTVPTSPSLFCMDFTVTP